MCNNVLEHLDEPDARRRDASLVAPGGVCVVNVPSWRGKFFLELSAFRLGVAPKAEMDDHKADYDPRDLWPLLVRAGFLPSEIKGPPPQGRAEHHRRGAASVSTPAPGRRPRPLSPWRPGRGDRRVGQLEQEQVAVDVVDQAAGHVGGEQLPAQRGHALALEGAVVVPYHEPPTRGAATPRPARRERSCRRRRRCARAGNGGLRRRRRCRRGTCRRAGAPPPRRPARPRTMAGEVSACSPPRYQGSSSGLGHAGERVG